MREPPQGDALLACARQVLRDDLLPVVPADQKHALLMALNAMAIAERQLRLGDAPLKQEQSSLQALLGAAPACAAQGNRQLAGQIRLGAADPGQPQRAAILAHLRLAGRQRLAESNPKVLTQP